MIVKVIADKFSGEAFRTFARWCIRRHTPEDSTFGAMRNIK